MASQRNQLCNHIKDTTMKKINYSIQKDRNMLKESNRSKNLRKISTQIELVKVRDVLMNLTLKEIKNNQVVFHHTPTDHYIIVEADKESSEITKEVSMNVTKPTGVWIKMGRILKQFFTLNIH